METIGIGITTRHRPTIFAKTLSQIKKFQPPNSKIVVVDDSDDNDKERLGIARAKNKCLAQLKDCDHIFLFDDDLYPIKEGWAEFYIKASKDSKIAAFSLTMMTTSFFAVCEEFEMGSQLLTFEGYDPIEVFDFKGIDILNEKRRLGLHIRHPYTFNVINHVELKRHAHSNGFMMYLSKICIDTIGGFNPVFGLYGGEHGDYFQRLKNVKLIPYVTVDVVGSEKYFYSYDEDKKIVESPETKAERMKLAERNTRLSEKLRFSIDYIPFEEESKKEGTV